MPLWSFALGWSLAIALVTLEVSVMVYFLSMYHPTLVCVISVVIMVEGARKVMIGVPRQNNAYDVRVHSPYGAATAC